MQFHHAVRLFSRLVDRCSRSNVGSLHTFSTSKPSQPTKASFSSLQNWKPQCSASAKLCWITPRPHRRSFASINSSPCMEEILTMDQHNKRVQSISTVIRNFYERKEKWRVHHGSTNSTRPTVSKNLVHIESLSNVLKIDPNKMTCFVEPNVPMDRLVEATLKHGLIPPVVMEFPGITVGGGYSGTCGESSSFRHGFFDKTIKSVEMVLATGEVIKLSPSENSDLFIGGAGAMGTFGVATLIELQLRQAKKFVRTAYHPVKNIKSAIKLIQSSCSDLKIDYIDGIMFSPTSGVIVTGTLTDELDSGYPITRFSRRCDPWFYLHAKDQIDSGLVKVDFIPLADYLFRYDRGGFWVGAAAFQYFKIPFNKFTRWALDDFLHTRMMYTALHASGQSKKFMVQDLALPYKTAEDFICFTHQEFDIWPLWLCPLKPSPMPTMHPHSLFGETKSDGITPEPILNIGLWGWDPSNPSELIEKNKALESKLKALGGMKWLYAHTYYEKEQFWEQFDQKWYQELREKYHAASLSSVYDKAKVNLSAEGQEEQAKAQDSYLKRLSNMWPFPGLYGIKKAIESRSYIAARKSEWKKFT
ncbi:hypothetical protein Golomagni_02406 [Golovinomyces magnicellulatus]|nr:hypothetical protein Golomagni_02406 [Golovinomyces magnicellulatus]